MVFKVKLNLVIFAFFLYMVRVSVAESLMNERERENTTKWRQDQKYNVSAEVSKLISRIPLNDTFGWKLFSTLEKYPSNFDVAFVVGPEKVMIKAPRLVLTYSSDALARELESHFEKSMMDQGEGISVPDLDPEAFKMFVELTILDTWSLEALEALELPSNHKLNLLSICHKYGMTDAVQNLTELSKDFFKDFGTHTKPGDLSTLSQIQLEAVLASDALPMNETSVYNYACSWAEQQCKKQKLPVTGENTRLVLGRILYQIRFPIMSPAEFATVTRRKGLLTAEEITDILQLIGMDEDRSKSSDTMEQKFKVEKRMNGPFTSASGSSSVVSLAKIFPAIDTPFVCDGSLKANLFTVNTTINLRGFGFLGPLMADSFYNVSVQIRKHGNRWSDITEKMEKRVFAQKSKTFYFIFDQPVVMDPIPYDEWSSYYSIHFNLKGPNTRSLQSTGFQQSRRIHSNNQEFVIWWQHSQLVEILYT